MGMYDTYIGIEDKQEFDVQLKCGPCCSNTYKVGDYVDCENKLDGIYLGLYGFVCFRDNKVVQVSSILKNSYGDCRLHATELTTYNSDFYRYLYGNDIIDKKEKEVKRLTQQARNLNAKAK